MSSRGLFVGPLLHLRTLQAFEGLSSVHLTTLAQEVDEVPIEPTDQKLDLIVTEREVFAPVV